MATALARRAKLLNVVETLAIGAAGGALFLFAHLPGGLISGAMIAVGIAAIAGGSGWTGAAIGGVAGGVAGNIRGGRQQ